ncbi:class I glutamine amidotransferase, putative [Synechococcus sp. PCC 7335]|uniref:type 1 glutamine amidotransferase n=1 Tax=Synechococcus sp. (strain ATCC 29403 / PCC 7335) TaxID=91464 RepID=UPI00017EBC0A|nr:type 1 glutamine amidotransferase [Synechococcus sp. PCC 7335]EDX87732.1 class I glutamine amidotransferase, putative [Synechococcus sp. PCC 7335]
MNILVIQSSPLDPIGVFGERLVHRGATLSVWLTEKEPMPPLGSYDGLVVLGGAMNAHEDDKFPHLRSAVDLIQKFHHENKPIVGICLGAQLIARAFGSRVYTHTAPELGFGSVRLVKSEHLDDWLKELPNELFLMQWHFDTFDLPPKATLLMTNDVCRHQAYRIGKNIYGFQFHFEVTAEIVMSWLSMKNDWIETNYPHLDEQIKAQVEAYGDLSAQFARHVADNWLGLFSQCDSRQVIT